MSLENFLLAVISEPPDVSIRLEITLVQAEIRGKRLDDSGFALYRRRFP
jgi:hypothetical protein